MKLALPEAACGSTMSRHCRLSASRSPTGNLRHHLSSPDDRRIRRIERDIEYLIILSNAKVQQAPAYASVRTSSDAVLSANVSISTGSEFDVEDTNAVQKQHIGP